MIRLFMSSKSGLQQAPLLAANDDEESSTILPLTRFEYGKEKYHDVTETQTLWPCTVRQMSSITKNSLHHLKTKRKINANEGFPGHNHFTWFYLIFYVRDQILFCIRAFVALLIQIIKMKFTQEATFHVLYVDYFISFNEKRAFR